MRLAIFWGSVAAVVYTYALFPLLVFVRAIVARRPFRVDEITPSVSLLIAARNEGGAIAAKLTNTLALDYPEGMLQVIVASDGSQDHTEEIVRGFAERGVELLALPRAGKAAALNAAIAAARGEILVFSDANSQYAPDAVRALVRPFADPGVGGVAGNQRYASDGALGAMSEGERSYWNFDRLLKQAESDAGSTISATGAIYAVRRNLVDGVPDGVTDDFAVSTGVIARGYRLVFAADAIAYEPVAASGDVEFGRKVRIMTRGLRGVLKRRALLNPARYGFYALQLLSHKLLRRLMAVPLLLLAVVSPLLWRKGAVYRLATLAQTGFYALASAGVLLSGTRAGRSRALSVPAFFCMVNAAALVAVWNIVRGRRIDRWEPQRPAGDPAEARTLRSKRRSGHAQGP